MNSQTSRKTNESPTAQKSGRECRKHLRYKTKPKHIKMTFPPFFSGSFEKVRLGLSTHRASNILGRLGTMSKNNLRRITLVRGPIWGILGNLLSKGVLATAGIRF